METPAKTSKLRQLMTEHDLSPEQVASILGRSKQSVRIWECNHKRTIPDHLLELLELKLTRGENVH